MHTLIHKDIRTIIKTCIRLNYLFASIYSTRHNVLYSLMLIPYIPMLALLAYPDADPD